MCEFCPTDPDDAGGATQRQSSLPRRHRRRAPAANGHARPPGTNIVFLLLLFFNAPTNVDSLNKTSPRSHLIVSHSKRINRARCNQHPSIRVNSNSRAASSPSSSPRSPQLQ